MLLYMVVLMLVFALPKSDPKIILKFDSYYSHTIKYLFVKDLHYSKSKFFKWWESEKPKILKKSELIQNYLTMISIFRLYGQFEEYEEPEFFDLNISGRFLICYREIKDEKRCLPDGKFQANIFIYVVGDEISELVSLKNQDYRLLNGKYVKSE